MRYAILSDIHSNIDALEAVFDAIESLRIDEIICLGDVVGYNAEPNACISLLKEKKIQTILGNHDSVACGLEEPWGFNPLALSAIMWTREHLDEDSREWLRSLPDTLNYGSFVAVHGAPKNHNVYLFSWEDVLPHLYFMEEQNCSLCFVGHTHTPAFFSEKSNRVLHDREEIQLDPEKYYFINPGSVGQPRDQNPAASFGIFDAGQLTFELVRVRYDVERASKRVLEVELPHFLSDRLLVGK
ncbi:MAG: metallophosphoesterase family protein [Candidatus Hydrogenedentes bacterium]|nr:metallophosphoesterase family protein [Candidatus Hydrogenedentota bacterium]